MRKPLAAVGLATVLTLGAGSSALAQSSAEVVAQADAANDDDADNTGLWGLLGLLGLAGLAGLKRRDDDRHRPVGGYDGSTRQP